MTIEDLGRAPFARVHAQMLAKVEEVRKSDRGGAVWFVEHDPVFTAGRGTKPDDLATEHVAVERGGKLTFHGPGQLVVYPILKLQRHDARAWLAALEAFGIAICADVGLSAQASVDGTGVFVAGKKVASIGVAIRHWVSFHGIAINVAMDLAPFHAIRPCGLAPQIMSDLATQAGRPLTLAQVRDHARARVSLLVAAAGLP